MSSPGKGRYTDYVSTQSTKVSRLHKLFNANPSTDGRGIFYDANLVSNQTNNSLAAESSVKNYTQNLIDDNVGVNTVVEKDGKITFNYFTGNAVDALPNTTVLSKNIKGGPSNSYMPDLASPGAVEGTVNFEKKETTFIKAEDYKPFLNLAPEEIDDRQNLGTVSPHISSPVVGLLSVGTNLLMGSSKK